jgi:virginiamycin B lyase
VVGRITATGSITEYPLPGPSFGHNPYGIATGSDGALWFTESATSQIGRISTSGDITEYPLPTPNAWPYRITAGPDGALWFTESQGNKIGRITTSGVVTEYPVKGLTSSSDPTDIVGGPDGALWFTNLNSRWVGRISVQGDVTTYPIPTACSPLGITAGPDKALWFACATGDMIGRITTAGVTTTFNVPTKDSEPTYITLGSDGALWFTENYSGKIGRVTTSGVFTEYNVNGTFNNGPVAISAGQDGTIWFGRWGYIARIQPSKSVTTTTLASSLNPSVYGQQVTWAAMVRNTGSVPPSGKVAFRWSRDGQNHVVGTAALDPTGVATLTRSNLNVDPFGAPYRLVAVYSGDAVNLGSTSAVLPQHVLQAKTAASINSSMNPSSVGQAVTFTATITSPTVTPTGPVIFTAGKQVLGTVQIVPWAHKATLTISTLPVGPTTIQVTYLGNSNVSRSSAALTQNVR